MKCGTQTTNLRPSHGAVLGVGDAQRAVHRCGLKNRSRPRIRRSSLLLPTSSPSQYSLVRLEQRDLIATLLPVRGLCATAAMGLTFQSFALTITFPFRMGFVINLRTTLPPPLLLGYRYTNGDSNKRFSVHLSLSLSHCVPLTHALSLS